jgi:alpha-tubulin suppressor-like RCC1 family protein
MRSSRPGLFLSVVAVSVALLCPGAGVAQSRGPAPTADGIPVPTGRAVVPPASPPIGPLTGVAEVTIGFDHGCARMLNGTVQCWGLGGELGDGTTTTRNTGGQVSGLVDAASISAGVGHTCAIRIDRTVVCWGYNRYGQLGDGTTTNATTFRVVSGLTDIQQISAGDLHTCALLADSTIACWGDNTGGQLGGGLTSPKLVPTVVPGLGTGWLQVSAGRLHTCALRSDGTVWCWGTSFLGEETVGSRTYHLVPEQIVGASGVVQISAGYSHTCALIGDGAIRCWGNNGGMIGDGTIAHRAIATLVLSQAHFVSVVAGGATTCALDNVSVVWCWGANWAGGVGDGGLQEARTIPSAVVDLGPVASVSSGSSCAVLGDASAWCWGLNFFGTVGDGTTTDRFRPVQVLGTHIGRGTAFDRASTSDGSASWFGRGE